MIGAENLATGGRIVTCSPRSANYSCERTVWNKHSQSGDEKSPAKDDNFPASRLAAGRMGYTTTEIGDMIAAAVAA